ncbi:NAD(P)H-dependent oxidoreductase [Nocardioides sp. AE5]|uniref:NADPH-dependent FMN reductase n=1 Tax=Nocardioides sp. AE5 TaxID=2962573 RepID=UPI0028822ABF|nr:NAD(P)H-dependent oxidoreductase [Nocardioides sp. AE5]MDT0202227.1 NAD(P)H-dependent oxidoreductase [Nocardioides sp. AE5]
MKIGIIIGSTRNGRLGSGVGKWVYEEALAHGGAEFELIELDEFNLELLTDATVPGAANRQYADEKVRRWSEKIDSLDSFVFVTPEYNHSVPAALKNAFDSIFPEWGGKALGLVGYGADGAVRAVEHWRTIAANAHLVAVRPQVSLSLFTDFAESGFAPQERRQGELAAVLDAVIDLGTKLRG